MRRGPVAAALCALAFATAAAEPAAPAPSTEGSLVRVTYHPLELTITKADLVRVSKSRSVLELFKGPDLLASYPVVFGRQPAGHKQQEGDQRTPEGLYLLDYKKEDSAFYRSLHVSYPNEIDLQRAAEKGVSAGGQIMIHGQKNGREAWQARLMQLYNWTDGCIALSNADMDRVWEMVDAGTAIYIEP